MSQSNDNIYELINTLRLEIKADIAEQGMRLGKQIGDLDTKLDKVVDNRIVPVEKDVNKLKVDSATGNVKLGVVIFIAASIVSTLVTNLLGKILK